MVNGTNSTLFTLFGYLFNFNCLLLDVNYCRINTLARNNRIQGRMCTRVAGVSCIHKEWARANKVTTV